MGKHQEKSVCERMLALTSGESLASGPGGGASLSQRGMAGDDQLSVGRSGVEAGRGERRSVGGDRRRSGSEADDTPDCDLGGSWRSAGMGVGWFVARSETSGGGGWGAADAVAAVSKRRSSVLASRVPTGAPPGSNARTSGRARGPKGGDRPGNEEVDCG